MNGRIIGIDFGSKRVGVAVSDMERKFALPLAVIANSRKLADEVAELMKDNGALEIVLGESRDYNGQPNPIFAEAEKFRKEMEGRGFAVVLEPEFMTSAQAERFQGKNDMTDASAAALILQSYLDKHR
ncbi:MAG: pre-16S rRNA-processing nuclease YqgF [Patescibacteria group bacterium]|nr:RuvX/YqgF family protein [Patescibacteria group bacterium]MDE1940508.1 pre-16S rRNA-processing nuclease YqgF [Patescibacteria group bacterium]MDE1966574.1 pre-16S rRNA-processing nuclease YqgF [Patescibacteria group bacterium]